MHLSDGEKLIAAMLADLMIHLKATDGIDPRFIRDALPADGWALKWKYPDIFAEGLTREGVPEEVADILVMYRVIEDSIRNLPPQDSAQLDSHYREFHGFDGNNESEHFAVAVFMVDSLDRFEDYRGRNMNSHMPMLDRYRRILATFKQERRANLSGEAFSLDQLKRVLGAD